MQSSLNVALPNHFRRPEFTFQLSLLLAGQANKRAHYGLSHRGVLYDGVCGESTTILHVHLRAYLSKRTGSLDQRAAELCDEITTDTLKLSAIQDSPSLVLSLTLHLARIQQFTAVSEIIRLGSQQSLDHTGHLHVQKGELTGEMLLGRRW
jgi:hypothetical protein